MKGRACNGSWQGTKGTIHEGGHRVPLIVRWPGKVKAGSVSDETVCLTDFFRTFAAMLGQVVPKDAGEDSYDLGDVLRGREYKRPLREATVHHSVSGQFAIRKGDWKLIEGKGDGHFPPGDRDKSLAPQRDPKTGRWLKLDYFGLKHDGTYQLYNLADDRAETKNLASERPEKVDELKALLERYRQLGRSHGPRGKDLSSD